MSKLDDKLKVLDEFMSFYGWSVYEYGNNYILLDDQTGTIEFYDWKYKLIDRICGRALDYETDENEFEDNKISKNCYKYIMELLFVYAA